MDPTCHADKQDMDFLTPWLVGLAIAKVHEL